MSDQSLFPKTYIVKRQEEGFRLDRFLSLRLEKEGISSSRGNIAENIRCGQVVHNQKKTSKPSQKVRMNDEVSLNGLLSKKIEERLPPRSIPEPKILFEDEQVLFVDKPAGLTTHPAHEGDISLVDWVIAYYPPIIQVGESLLRPGIVHRLDKDTSGVLVIAKTERAFSELKRMFQDREIEKTYFALVEGNLSQLDGEICFAITRIPHSEKRSIRRVTDDPEARPSVTSYRVLRRMSNADFIEVRPKTGRTHQIRVHFSALQHPIVGDHLYGFLRKESSIQSPRQMLHAGRIEFTLFGRSYRVEAPLPSDFEIVLQGLTGNH